MGTSNFYNENASNVFAFGKDFDQWDYETYLENLKRKLDAIGYSGGGNTWTTSLKAYPAEALGVKSEARFFGKAEVIVSIQALVRSGYYAGANLDWEIRIEICGYEMELEWPHDCKGFGASIEELLYSDFGFNKGMAAIQAPNVRAWIDQTQEDLILELEDLYREGTTPLNVAARFSNGEVIYTSQ